MLNSIKQPKRPKSLNKIIVNAVLVITVFSAIFTTTDSQALHKKENNYNSQNCVISNKRPKNSKWILKNKSVTEGIRYTTDVYQTGKTKNQVTFNYLLKDSTKKNQVVANFSLSFKKSEKRWRTIFEGCSILDNNKDNTLIVAIYDDQNILKSIELNNSKKSLAIGSVRYPNANHVRVLNKIDLFEEK